MLLDLRLTMESGQPPHFLWNCHEGRYWRVVGGERCELWQEKERLHSTAGFEGYAGKLLREKDDLAAICRKIDTDRFMHDAIGGHRGLRITKSEPWETIVCFICSINNNIPRIKKMTQALMVEGEVMPPEVMFAADLSGKKLGYREKFLKATAEAAMGYDLRKIGRMKYEKAKEALIEFEGVGPKVADCVLLFGYGVLEAFPVDVWIAREMKRRYSIEGGKKVREFAKKKWGNYAGYAQQYIYCAANGR